MSTPARAAVVRRGVQLVLSSVVLGLGVVLVLRSTLGADGYSMFVSGLSRSTGLPYAVANAATGGVLVALAAARGVRPGVGTLVQPLVVGLTVQQGLALTSEPSHLGVQVLLAAASLPVLALGVAGYLGTRTGAGPPEAATLAFDPPLPFRVGYGVLQVTLALAGWALGADLGPTTVAVALGVGPLVHLATTGFPRLDVAHRGQVTLAGDGGRAGS